MNKQDLINNPHYPALMKLATSYGLDEAIVEECALGVIARLQALIENDIQPDQTHVVAAIQNWFECRQRMHDQYRDDPYFREQMHERIYNNITGEQ